MAAVLFFNILGILSKWQFLAMCGIGMEIPEPYVWVFGERPCLDVWGKKSDTKIICVWTFQRNLKECAGSVYSNLFVWEVVLLKIIIKATICNPHFGFVQEAQLAGIIPQQKIKNRN